PFKLGGRVAQETNPGDFRGRLLRARRERPRRRATDERDEIAPSHAMPVEDKAYQRAALCVTAKLARLCPLWVIHDRDWQSQNPCSSASPQKRTNRSKPR